MTGKTLCRELTAIAILCGLSGVCAGREVTAVEKSEAWDAARKVVGGDDRILQMTAFWGEQNGTPVLAATVTTRPFEVNEGLCVAEGYRLQRREGDRDFTVLNDKAPVSQYWQRDGSCDVVDPTRVTDLGRIPDTVWVWQSVATTHIAQILRGADEILSLATPEVRCNEPIMPKLFQPDVRLRISRIELGRKNQPGVGIRYAAYYRRQDDESGVVVQFTMLEERFEVVSACYWAA